MAVMRLTGLATGLDTETMVKQLIDAESIKLNHLKQKQQKQTWLIDSYRQFNSELLAFRNNTLFNMKLSGAYNKFDAVSDQATAVMATATSSAIAGTYRVAVKQLAKSASLTGNQVVIDSSKTLGDEAQGTHQLSEDITFTIQTNNDPKNPNSIKTAEIDIKTTDKMSDVVSKINNAKDAEGKSLGLQAIYDNTLQQFIVKTKETGAATKIEFGAEAQTFLKDTLGINNLEASGQNAEINVNDTEVTNLASNNVTIMGINLSLKNTTYDAKGDLTTSTVTVTQNIDEQMNVIKDFIEQYNSLLDKMTKAVNEPVYRDYQPLLEDHRKEMSEREIELWEEKAKSGLHRNDGILTGLINKMRSAMNSVVNNGSSYHSLGAIGISSKSYQDKGKLYIDETKLREAIQNDPDAVRNLFTQMGETTEGTNGIINRLSDDFQQATKDLTARAGSSGNSQYDQSVIGKLLSRIQSDITKQTDLLQRKEDQYYRQFAAMEQAVVQFNSQSSWLYQQMGMGQ